MSKKTPTKTCRKCGGTFPTTKKYWTIRGKYLGCKACQRQYKRDHKEEAKEWYNANRDRINAGLRVKRAKKKAETGECPQRRHSQQYYIFKNWHERNQAIIADMRERLIREDSE